MVASCLKEATGEVFTFNERECQLALEELISEDLTPMFTQICGLNMGEDDPFEMAAFRQERLEECIKGTVEAMIKH